VRAVVVVVVVVVVMVVVVMMMTLDGKKEGAQRAEELVTVKTSNCQNIADTPVLEN
jgi:hypothetical protein